MARVKNKKICLLLAGGTILSEKDKESVKKKEDIAGWVARMPELLIMGELEPVFVYGEEEAPSGKELWQKLAQEIFFRLNNYDGFIITSRVDEILFTAISASFAITNLNKPVVFTGSQLPLVDKELVSNKKKSFGGLGVKSNLINAVQVATMDFPAVGLMFGNSFLRAVKARRSAVYDLNIFASVDGKYLAKIDFGISPQERVEKPAGQPFLRDKFDDNIAQIKYFPGFKMSKMKMDFSKAHGLLVGSLPIEPFSNEFLKELTGLKMPVVVHNRFYVPRLNRNNIIEMSNISKEAALVKFMWALGQTNDIAQIRSMMLNQSCGEFITNL